MGDLSSMLTVIFSSADVYCSVCTESILCVDISTADDGK